MKVKALLELLADYDPEMDVLLVVPFLRISDIDPCLSLMDLYDTGEVEFLAIYPGEPLADQVEVPVEGEA